MNKKIVEMYISEDLQVSDIKKKLKISTEEVYRILNEEGYPISKGRKKEWILKAKDAVDYYINNPTASVTKTANLFEISADSLSNLLKSKDISLHTTFREDPIDFTIFDSIDTEEKAYWLGFIFADGYISSAPITKGSDNSHRVEICLALIDTGHLFKFDAFVGSKEPRVKVYNYKDQNGKDKQHVKWFISNKHLWETLNSYGCTPRKSLTLKFPNIDSKLKRHFVRGYFDGDGSFGVYGTKGLFGELQLSCVGTEDMIYELFKDVGVYTNIYHHAKHDEKTLTISVSSSNAKSILDYMYKDSTVYLDRKFNKYLEICRLWEKSHRGLQGNIGEGLTANTEITTETKESVAS